MACPQHIQSRAYRQRDPILVARFGLRDLRVPFMGETCASNAFRKSLRRRKAGRKAWATRVQRYGPSGRKAVGCSQAASPIVVVPPRMRDSEVGGDDEVDRQVERGDGAGIPDARDDGVDMLVDGMEDVGDLTMDDDTPHPHYEDLSVHDDTAAYPPAATPPPPPSTNPPVIAQDFTRLLNARRAHLLGPQDVTSTVLPPPTSTTFTIFQDARADEDGAEDREANKENVPPEWHGREGGAPPALVGGRILPSQSLDREVGEGRRDGHAVDHREEEEGQGLWRGFRRFFDF